MGYTKGRRLTEEFIISEARKYKTKREIADNDPSILATARRLGILHKIHEHIIDVPFSTPQLICKKILESILQETCLYNTRAIIKPYELDIYFEKYKLAFEYNGKRWHNNKDTKKRDRIKKELCIKNNITLIVISQNSLKYEQDIKKQLVKCLPTINKITNKNINLEQIHSIECIDVYKDIPTIKDVKTLKEKINNCKNIVEFQKKYRKEYKTLIQSKQLHLLDTIRVRKKTLTKEALIKLCEQISNYSDLIEKNFWLYLRCKKYGILKTATKHMYRKKSRYTIYTNEELFKEIKKYKTYTELNKNNSQLLYEIKRRNLLERCYLTTTKNERRSLKHYKEIFNLDYFNTNVVPLIRQGMTVCEICSKKLLPAKREFIKKMLHTFGTEELIKKEKELCFKNARIGLTLSPYRKK